jgi:LEA14-like dessication related protein
MPTYTTWNPSDKSADITLSNGDLTAKSTNNGHDCARTIISESTGKWYWEITSDYDSGGLGAAVGIGVAGSSLSSAVGSGVSDYAYRSGGKKGNSGSWEAYGDSWTTGDIIGIALDLDAGKIWFSKNGVWQASGNPADGTGEAFSGISDTMFGMFSLYYIDEQLTANFGDSAFTYSVPSGFSSGLYGADPEVILTEPFLVTTSLQSNIQVELVPGTLQAESSMSISEPFWGTFIELPSPFAAQSSLQAKTGLEIAVTPLIAQTNLQSNLQVELVSPAFAAQSELSVGEIFWGHRVELPEPFSANASLQANTQIELVPSPLIATGALFSNLGIEVSAGILNATGAILATPVYPIILTGAKRIYLFTLTGTADGVEDITIPISSFQSRAKSVGWGSLKMYSLGTSYVVINWVSNTTYLSVVIPGLEYAADINDRLNGDLVIRMGYKKDDEILLSEIAINVTFENIRIDEGAINKSITLDGHGYDIIHELQELNLAGASYKSLDGGNLRYRCAPNLYLRPGDTATINGDSFTVKNIIRSVSPGLETYEISE